MRVNPWLYICKPKENWSLVFVRPTCWLHCIVILVFMCTNKSNKQQYRKPSLNAAGGVHQENIYIQALDGKVRINIYICTSKGGLVGLCTDNYIIQHNQIYRQRLDNEVMTLRPGILHTIEYNLPAFSLPTHTHLQSSTLYCQNSLLKLKILN